MVGWIILAVAAIFIALLLVRASDKKPDPDTQIVSDGINSVDFDKEAALLHLQEAIRLKTVSHQDPELTDFGEFLGFQAFLQKSYPLIHEKAEREVLLDYALLYRLPGKSSGNGMLVMGHMDVVPVEEETLGEWEQPPFSGNIDGEYVYGRGALDMKGHVVAFMEAIEAMLNNGFELERDLYIAIGHDEELMHETGASAISSLLKERGVRLQSVLDEGGAIQSAKSLGVEGTLALVGVCEKGYMDLEMSVKQAGGHASMPGRRTALGQLAQAITAVEIHPFKPNLNEPVRAMLRAIAPYATFGMRFVLNNLFIFGGILKGILLKYPMTAALVHTTVAPTMAQGSDAANVLPQRPRAVLNIRIAPGETAEQAVAHVKKYAGSSVQLKTLRAVDPSPISDVQSDAYRALSGSIAESFPEMIVAPYPMLGATDSRYFHNVCDHVFRFMPFRGLGEDVSRMHGVGERLKISDFYEGIEFFVHYVQNNMTAGS